MALFSKALSILPAAIDSGTETSLRGEVRSCGLAAPVQPRVRAQSQAAQRAKLPPPSLPRGQSPLGSDPGCFCWSPLLSNVLCWSLWHSRELEPG